MCLQHCSHIKACNLERTEDLRGTPPQGNRDIGLLGVGGTFSVRRDLKRGKAALGSPRRRRRRRKEGLWVARRGVGPDTQMSSTPDRGKECLPPKKRESRQGSSDRAPADEFKPPAPLRIRQGGVRQAEIKEPADGPPPIPRYGRDLLPPPAPPPPAHKFALPWPLSYPTATPGPFSTQLGDRCSPGLPAWRDQCGRSADPSDPSGPHHSRWQRGEAAHVLPHHPAGGSAYKTHYPSDSRAMWSYFNTGKHDFPSLFSNAHLFPQPVPYPKDPRDSRRSYSAKRPNGFDRMDGRHTPMERLSATEDYLFESKVKQAGSSHTTNGKRRYQDDQRSMSGAVFKDSHGLEGPNAHSSPQEKGPCATPPNTPDARTFKVPLDALSMTGPPGEAHIYYALGPVYSGLSQPPLAYPLYSAHGQAPVLPLYGLQAETAHPVRNSQLSPLVEAIAQNNSHSPDQSPAPAPESLQPLARRVPPHVATATAATAHYSRPSSSGPALPPQPPVLLPHFARGSLIELSGGRLKRVEELQTEDFLLCADTSPEFHLSSCTVLLISPSPAPGFSHLQVLLTDRNTQELLKVLVEYPFFVRDRGWSSCCPQRTAQLYGLRCRQLSVGDVCLALTPSPSAPPRNHARGGEAGLATHCAHGRAGYEFGTQRAEMMPPPAPVPPPPPAHAPLPRDLSQGRKRRWSAPEVLGADRTP
ncbi:hypothetical protein AAFF_G00240280 [Aldrovandia affinis]|uniref:AXH domain-containing protein n=1 Tax=Aldrovandia affinis TaxID=143900 RepID=A0AAD7SUG6_9TELE|nr:hypothetical protein AAFF_G00240280 [Aldrovandia affinis]